MYDLKSQCVCLAFDPQLAHLEDATCLGELGRVVLLVDYATARCHPLRVAEAEAPRAAERVAVVDEAVPRHRNRLETAMRVLWKAWDCFSVVHRPARWVPKVLPR